MNETFVMMIRKRKMLGEFYLEISNGNLFSNFILIKEINEFVNFREINPIGDSIHQ